MSIFLYVQQQISPYIMMKGVSVLSSITFLFDNLCNLVSLSKCM